MDFHARRMRTSVRFTFSRMEPVGGSISSALKTLIVASGFLMLHGCADEPTALRPGLPQPLSSVANAVQDVPAVTIDLPATPRPWDTSSVALALAITAGEGRAVIALKNLGSARALQTGIRAGVSSVAIQQGIELLQARGVEIIDVLAHIGAVRVRLAPALVAPLRDHPLVDFIEPRQYGEIAAQTTPWGITLVRAPEAWSITTGGGAKILVIDTGHDQGHEDLPAVPSLNCAGAYGGCSDGNGHGTHVLGIATARNNTLGVVGVAPGLGNSDVYVYAACTSTGSCPTDDVTAGINSGIFTTDVISLSLRQPYDAAQASAVAQAWLNNIVLVAAAGNNGGNSVIYPAVYTNVIGVSGVNEDKSFANPAPCGHSSNWGSHVDLSAPFTANSTYPNNNYVSLCGTSMATPHVSGAAALLFSQNPTWTNQQVVDRLFATSEDRGDRGRDDLFGYGIVDAAEAVGVQPPPPLSVSIDGPTQIEPGATCTWYAVVGNGTSPYSYQWTASQMAPSSGTDYYFTASKDAGSFATSWPLKVVVTDAVGGQGEHEITVYEDPSAGLCPF